MTLKTDLLRGSVWVNGGRNTNTAGVSGGKSDEALFAPGSAPRVLDFPGTIDNSDKQNSVVEVGSAVTEHT